MTASEINAASKERIQRINALFAERPENVWAWGWRNRAIAALYEELAALGREIPDELRRVVEEQQKPPKPEPGFWGDLSELRPC